MVNRLVTSPLSHCRILRQNHVDPGWRRHPAMGCIITQHGLCMNRDGACGPPRLGRQEDYRFHHEGGTEHGRIDSGWFWSTPSHQSCVLNYANMGRKHWCISQFLGFAPPCLVVKVHLPCDKGHGWMPSMWVLGPADGFSSRVFHPSTGDDLGWFYANWDDLIWSCQPS